MKSFFFLMGFMTAVLINSTIIRDRQYKEITILQKDVVTLKQDMQNMQSAHDNAMQRWGYTAVNMLVQYEAPESFRRSNPQLDWKMYCSSVRNFLADPETSYQVCDQLAGMLASKKDHDTDIAITTIDNVLAQRALLQIAMGK